MGAICGSSLMMLGMIVGLVGWSCYMSHNYIQPDPETRDIGIKIMWVSLGFTAVGLILLYPLLAPYL